MSVLVMTRDPCSVSDVDQDGDVDDDDFALLRVAYQVDCNNNGRSDLTDLFLGTSLDSNANWIPDECDPIPPGKRLREIQRP